MAHVATLEETIEIDVRQILTDNPILLLFVVLGFGYLMGNLKIGPVRIGATAGVLLCGLLFGHFGYTVGPLVATFGFTLFIFSVGIQAGPTFFSAFRADGRRYVALAAFVAAVAVVLTILLSQLFALDFGVRAGIAAGALTSTPTLAGAQDAIASGLAALPEGVTADQAAQNVGVGYAITYIFGTVGLIMFVRYLPGLFKVDLVEAAREAEAAQRPPGPGKRTPPTPCRSSGLIGYPTTSQARRWSTSWWRPAERDDRCASDGARSFSRRRWTWNSRPGMSPRGSRAWPISA